MSDAETVLRNLLDACDRGRPLADIHDRLRVEVGRLDRATAAPTRPTREQMTKALYNTDTGTNYKLSMSACNDLADAALALIGGDER